MHNQDSKRLNIHNTCLCTRIAISEFSDMIDRMISFKIKSAWIFTVCVGVCVCVCVLEIFLKPYKVNHIF